MYTTFFVTDLTTRSISECYIADGKIHIDRQWTQDLFRTWMQQIWTEYPGFRLSENSIVARQKAEVLLSQKAEKPAPVQAYTVTLLDGNGVHWFATGRNKRQAQEIALAKMYLFYGNILLLTREEMNVNIKCLNQAG